MPGQCARILGGYKHEHNSRTATTNEQLEKTDDNWSVITKQNRNTNELSCIWNITDNDNSLYILIKERILDTFQ